jgi:hypothetical protein
LRGKRHRSLETAAGRAWKIAGGDSMKYRVLFSFLLTVLFVMASGCGSVKNCPVCGTTLADGYTNIVVIPVPEHNPTGEPGGPFNSFDISLVDPVNHRFFVSDRIGLDVVVVDTNQNVAVGAITGFNGVTGAGVFASTCPPTIPPVVSVEGNWVRYGCRTGDFHIPGFGANGFFGGFPGAQCCASRSNGVNPLSAPDGEAVTPDGKTLFIANGSSMVVAFDLSTMNFAASPPVVPSVLATIPTGLSPDYDGQVGNSNPFPGNPSGNTTGVSGCIASSSGRAFSDPSCGDLRADEMSYDPKDQILLVANGDPGFPFLTFIDVSGINARTSNCLPVDQTTLPLHYGPPLGNALGPINPPSCIIGQIYYDNAGAPGAGLSPNVPVDSVGGAFPCPDPSNPQVNSGVSGTPPFITGTKPIPCHHGPVLTISGAFCDQINPATGCTGALSPAGLGGSAWNPNTGHFLITNANATADLTVGTVDEIDPRLTDTTCGGKSCGPIVINSFVMPNCMPTSVVQGPGDNFLVGCADHDGEAFPPNMYVINGTSGAIIATIDNVGGVDEIWYNPGDNRYYLAARDMPTGPVMGVIDARTNQWLVNVTTNSNSHSISADPSNNHIFVPLQAGGICTTQSANGCVGVYAQQ